MRFVDKILALFVICIVLLSLGIYTDVVGITYPVADNRSTLKRPVKVTAIGTGRMTLADGRVLDMADAFGRNWPEMVAGSNHLVETTGAGNPSKVLIYVDKPGPVDAKLWEHPIRIPVLPQHVSQNVRTLIGAGKIVR